MLFQVTQGTLGILWEEPHRRKTEGLSARATTAILSPGGTGKCVLLSSPKTYQTVGFVASELIQHAHLIHGTFIFCIWLFSFRNTCLYGCNLLLPSYLGMHMYFCV